ncbi:MAG: hypothetical protein OHK0026_06540 [Rhodocyclaceae bacterium]
MSGRSHTAESAVPVSKRLRDSVLAAARRADDAIAERVGSTRMLFVFGEPYAFSCQAGVIRELLGGSGILVRTTTAGNKRPAELVFSDPRDREIFARLHVPASRARYAKWHMIVQTHIGGFHPARNALRVYMHHGPGFGILGAKTFAAARCDVFLGLSEREREWFDTVAPDLFARHRAFFPIGFPKSDALVRGAYDAARTLARLGLPARRTILITSHWKTGSTLRVLMEQPLRALAAAMPDANVIQTGHPWLWEPNRDIPAEWQRELMERIRCVESAHPNARFVRTGDVEPLLGAADLLVGDYSSVMTTYSLTDRPIVFFDNPQVEFYLPAFRDLFRNACHVFSQPADLVPACLAALAQPQARAGGRRAMRETFYANPGHAAQEAARVLAAIGSVCSVHSPKWQRVIELSRAMTPSAAPAR